MISNLIDRKARMPHGAAKAIAATLQPGVELIVQPNYINGVKTAARKLKLKITTRKIIRPGGYVYSAKLVEEKKENAA